MDPLELLSEVSEAYRRLRTLSINAVQLVESGDDDSSNSSRTRLRFAYLAPDRIRFERAGRGGMLQVADRETIHTLFSPLPMSGGPRYVSMPASRLPLLPHSFCPEFPFAGDAAFLFGNVEDRVEAAELLREEEGCLVLSVRYAPSAHPSFVVHGSPVFFWVRTDDHMILRQQGRVGHRQPTMEEVSWSSHTISVESLRVDEPVPEEIFRFTPPPGATLGRSGVIGGGGSGGFMDNSADDAKRIEQRGSHSWDGDTLVEQSRWKMRGFLLEFERRLSFSEDGTELRVGERIGGPAGDVTGAFVVPLR